MRTAAPVINPNATLANLKGLALVALSIILVIVAIRTVWSKHRQGDISGTFSTVAVVLGGLMIVAIAGSVSVMSGYGGAMLNALTGLLS